MDEPGFGTRRELLAEGDLTLFSRSLLERLAELDRDGAKRALGRWLSKKQIEGLLARRDLILAVAERRVAAHGEEAVLFP